MTGLSFSRMLRPGQGSMIQIASYKKYKKRTKSDPYIYTFDLTGYGTLQFEGPKTRTLAGFNPLVFEVLLALEDNPGALYRRIECIELT